MLADGLIRWTARLAVACYVMRLMCELFGTTSRTRSLQARIWWSVGCAWFTAHVVTAFHFQHHWSQTAAWDYTAQRTAELTGWKSGIGLWINEAFLCFWLIDTIHWWLCPTRKPTGWWYWSVQAVFAFLMFQSTFVFGPSIWKPVVLAIIVILGTGGLLKHHRPSGDLPDGSSGPI